MKSVIGIDACQSVLCKVRDDFAVDDRDLNIQEGNGLERVIACELYSGVDAIEVTGESVKIL